MFMHWHFGFDDQQFRTRLTRVSEGLLSIEAAQYSVASWLALPTWLAANPEHPQLQLFNLLNWIKPTSPLHWAVGLIGNGMLASKEDGCEGVTLSVAQPALYETGLLSSEKTLVAKRMRTYYLPPAGAEQGLLTQGMMSGRPLPVAAWASQSRGAELAETLRVANSASTSPLVWSVGRHAASNLKAALLKRSSVLLFIGRVPAAGSYSREACPEVRLVVATTTRPRALRWGEVPMQWRTVQAGPALAEWFGLPAARELTYSESYFYDAPTDAHNQELTKSIAAFTAIQNAENERRAAADDAEFLAPLPWNLLHWIRDKASAEAVFEHKAKQLVRLDPVPKRQLTDLLRRITNLLAEVRPLWKQLENLAVTELAYVVVPIHVARPNYLQGWVSLTRDLRTQRLPALAHLTFISLSELKRTAENPNWPVYVTTVEPRYWWALRQLPLSTEVRWLLSRPLLHNSFCHALHQQYEQESTELGGQLLPLTSLAAIPAQAVAELAADMQAAAAALNLPAYTPPARFQRVGNDRVEQPAVVPDLPATDPTARYRRPAHLPAPAAWPELSATELNAADRVGAVPDEPSWLELDEAVLLASATTLTAATDLDQVAQCQQAEEEIAVAVAELAAELPALPRSKTAANSQPQPVAARVTRHRLVWQRHPTQAGAFVQCQLGQVPIGSFYLDEQELRKRLNRATATQVREVTANSLPFWKQALRTVVSAGSNRPDWLYNRMENGSFGGAKLELKYTTFLRDYLAWDRNFLPTPSETRIPGSYQNRAAVAQVIGGGHGEQDEMQLLGWELKTGRTLTSAASQQMRQDLQAARRALLAWWQHRPTRHEEMELTETTLQKELTSYAATHTGLFGPAFGQQTGRVLGELVSDYFLGLLLESLQKQA